MIVRQATESDLWALIEMAREFVAETAYAFDFDEGIATARFLEHIAHPDMAVFVGEDGGALTGLAIVAHDRDFIAQRLGYVIKFYVRAAYRGTVAGRGLAAACVTWFREHLCWAAFATATANIGEDRRFANLLAKFGFVACGPTMMRNFSDG